MSESLIGVIIGGAITIIAYLNAHIAWPRQSINKAS